MRIVCVIILVTCFGMACFYGEANAQNRFFEDKQTGLGLMAILGSGEGVTSYGVGLAGTNRHGFDLNFGFAAADGSRVFSIGSAFPISRPSDTSILGIEIQAEYSVEEHAGSTGSNGYSAGLDSYLRFDASKSLQIMPGAGVAYAGVFGWHSNNNDFLISANVSFLINRKVFITPWVTSYDGAQVWGGQVGFVIPTRLTPGSNGDSGGGSNPLNLDRCVN